MLCFNTSSFHVLTTDPPLYIKDLCTILFKIVFSGWQSVAYIKLLTIYLMHSSTTKHSFYPSLPISQFVFSKCLLKLHVFVLNHNHNVTLTSFTNVFAILRRTSGAIFGTRSEYSPMSHNMLALAIGTVMVSVNLAMWVMISLCAVGYTSQSHSTESDAW